MPSSKNKQTKHNNMIFQIKSRNKELQWLQGSKVFMTGEPSFISNTSPMRYEMIDAEKNIKQYRTGFQDGDINTNPEFNEEQKEIYKEKAKKIREFVIGQFPQAEDNKSAFWNNYRTNLKLTTQLFSKLFNTETIEGAILYLSLIGGGFPNVSVTEDLAYENSNSYYLTTQEDFVAKEVKAKFGDKRKALVNLDALLEKKGLTDLVYFSYMIPALRKNGFTFNTAKERLEESFMEFVEGDLNKIDKKKAAEDFTTLFTLYTNDKETFIAQAIIEAAIYFGILHKGKGNTTFYVNSLTSDQVGSNSKEIYAKLSRPEKAEELKELIEATKAKLKQ